MLQRKVNYIKEALTEPINIIGMPEMMGKVVVMDPTGIVNLEDMNTFIYNPGTPDYGPAMQKDETQMLPYGINDVSVGAYSNTDGQKGIPLNTAFHSVMTDVASRVPKGAVVVEFGAGSQTKTPILLEAIAPAAYIPVDISGDYLELDYQGRRVAFYDYGPRIGIPIVGFSIGNYWDNYYRGRPFWNDRARWYNHRVARAPEWRAPPGWHANANGWRHDQIASPRARRRR